MPRRPPLLAVATLLALSASAAPASAVSPGIVMSEFRTRGPAGGNDEFVELRNRSAAPVSIAGYRLAGCASTGGNVSNRATVPDGVSLAAGQAYLFVNNGSAGYSGSVADDQTYGTGFTDFATSNESGIRILDAGGATVDGVGSPTSPCHEGTGFTTPTANGDNSFERLGGTTDTDDNVADFQGPKPGSPQNSSDPPPPGERAPAVAATTPTQGQDGVSRDASMTITFSEPVTTSAAAFGFECGTTAIPFAFAADPAGTSVVLGPTGPLPANADCTVTIAAAGVSDDDTDDPPDTLPADFTLSFGTAEASVENLRIHEIQGRQHVSPYRGVLVAAVPGVITARRSNGFYFQDPSPDSDPRTSEGLFVFTSSAPGPALQPGIAVAVSGRVSEFRGAAGNLSTTQISHAVTVVTGTGSVAPTVVGAGGRVPPTAIIDDDTPDPLLDDPPLVSGDVDENPAFDPEEDGIDFYESLEGMLTEVRDALATQPTNDFGEVPTLADGGAGATGRSARGGILARAFDMTLPQEYRLGDFNPERIIFDDAIVRPTPPMDVGDRFAAPVRAVVDYSFGNFKFLALEFPSVVDGGLLPERTRAQRSSELSVAAYNVENLDPTDGAARFAAIAGQIVTSLRSPDIVSLIEMQDNNGAAQGDSDATVTFQLLIDAIRAAGGPVYDFRQIDPVPNADGGEPGGNIRVGFIFQPARVGFVDRGSATATTATEDDPAQRGAQLTFSPGRVDPGNPVWANSRKPLAGQFRFRGDTLFVVANHFNSKGGDAPVLGRVQEPTRPSEVQRRGQARALNAWVERLQRADPFAKVVALGDFNDFDFSETSRVLERGVEGDRRFELLNLWRTLPQPERYSYIFEGNAQVLDSILVSPILLLALPELDGVHVNSEFTAQVSDHDPVIVRFRGLGR